MSKLENYINQINLDSKRQIEDDYLESLKIEAQELDFKQNKKEILINSFLGGLEEISKKTENFDYVKLEEQNDDFNYFGQYEILLYSDYGVAQYYLEAKTDLYKNPKEVCIDFESSGYSRKLETKIFEFKELKNLDLEQFIIDCIEEFKQFN